MSIHLGGLSQLRLHIDNLPVPGPSDRSQAIRELQEQVEQLTLVCMAMWSLMRQQSNLTEEDLIERVKEIDLLDGVADAKMTQQVGKCGKCSRVMSPRHKKCLYCGHQRVIATAFDTLG